MKLSNSELACAKQYFDGNPAALVSLAISGFKWKLLEHIKPKWVEISENLYQGSGDILRDMTVLKDGIDYLRSELEMECSDFDFSPTEARNAAKQLTLQMKAIVFGSVPPQLAFALRKLFQGVFRSYVVCSGGVANLDESCQGCAREQDACCCKQILECSAEIIRNLQKLELVDRLITKEAASISYSTVEKHVNETVSGSFDQAHLTELLQDGPIADWPDSMPAIQDLKKCFDLVPVNLKKEVVASLKKSVSARLLHTGVSTSVILTAYMQAVNSLRLLDPSGVIMDQVCHSIRQYLRFVSTVRVIRNTKEGSFDRQRPDTVRCIVSFLTEKNNISFGTETMTEETLFLDGNNSDREDEQGWKNWEPDPVDLCEAHGRGGHRKADMMSMLVSVYGSKELFVKEYCQLLSERLLRNFKYDAETEKRYLEMLKVRFGDSDHTLFQCEVMLKDMKDSDRLNKDINERAVHRNDNIPPVSARILSQQYWPQVREERIKLPEAAQEALDIFRKAFEDKKSGSRTIEWWPNLGRNYHKLRDTFSLSQMTCEKLEVSNLSVY